MILTDLSRHGAELKKWSKNYAFVTIFGFVVIRHSSFVFSWQLPMSKDNEPKIKKCSFISLWQISISS